VIRTPADVRRMRVRKESGGGPRLATRRIDDETIVVPISTGVGDLDAIYTLNDLGSRIWQLIDGATSVQQIIDAIHAEYEVSEEQAAHDVLEFLEELALRKLITVTSDGPGDGAP
jgi:Coenzyme PQQ synthesis protein D (PqqD)